jgi:uncharacterized protein (DUF2249 family)
MGYPEDLDVCQTPISQLSPLVFERFDTLALAGSFVLATDHNPVLVEGELEARRPGQATWQRLNRGPAKYRIRIRRVARAHVLNSLVATRPDELPHEIHNM